MYHLHRPRARAVQEPEVDRCRSTVRQSPPRAARQQVPYSPSHLTCTPPHRFSPMVQPHNCPPAHPAASRRIFEANLKKGQKGHMEGVCRAGRRQGEVAVAVIVAVAASMEAACGMPPPSSACWPCIGRLGGGGTVARLQPTRPPVGTTGPDLINRQQQRFQSSQRALVAVCLYRVPAG